MIAINSLELADFIKKNCLISAHSDYSHIFLECRTKREHALLIRCRKNIKDALAFILNSDIFYTRWVTILVEGDRLKTCFAIGPTKMGKIIIPGDFKDLIQECISYEGSCGIVRMSDHKGLFSNERIMFSSAAPPNDWIGKKMDDYWFKDELDTYLSRLNKEEELRGYSYVAKLFDGRAVKMTVDARVIQWHGESARIVKTIDRELLV